MSLVKIFIICFKTLYRCRPQKCRPNFRSTLLDPKSIKWPIQCFDTKFGCQITVYFLHFHFTIYFGIFSLRWSLRENFRRPPKCRFGFLEISDRWKMSQDGYFGINILFPWGKQEKRVDPRKSHYDLLFDLCLNFGPQNVGPNGIRWRAPEAEIWLPIKNDYYPFIKNTHGTIWLPRIK